MVISLSLFASAKDEIKDIKVINSSGKVVATYEIVTNDPSVDARDAIQKALKYAKDYATSSDIYTVKLPKGKYGLYQSLNLFSNTIFDLSDSVILRGGDCSTMIRFGYAKDTVYGYDGYENITVTNGTLDADDNGRNSIMHFAHASGVEVSDMTFTNTTDANHLLAFAACENVVIKDCVFSNMVVTEDLGDFNCEALQIDILKKGYFNYPAYDGTITKNVTITGCTFKNVARGLGTHSAMIGYYFDGITVKNNTFKDIESYAIRTVNYINSKITNNTITDCGSGISCGTITNESLGNFYAPTGKVKIVENANIIISNNNISLKSNGADTAAFGIRLIGKNLKKFKDKTGKTFTGDLRISGVKVENNTITSSVNKKNFNAIHVDGAKGSKYSDKSNIRITGNKITFNYPDKIKNTVYGIKVWDSENVYIYKNKITDKKARIHSGMTLDDCKGIIIKNNTLTGADNFGIKLGKTDKAKVASNTVTKTGSNGIYVFTGSKNVSVTSNKIKDFSGNGIAVSDGHASSISSNKIYNCKKYSIYITKKGKADSISSNYVCGGKDTGIYLNQKATATTISKNTIDVVSNKVDGICVNNSAKFSNITDNKINVKSNKESKDLKVACKYGIRIASDSCNGKKISGNTVKGCAGYSIYLSSKAKVKTISSNYVCGGKDTGIYLNSRVSATTISKNIIDVVSDKVDGICVNNSAKVTNITGNKINTKTEKDSSKLKVKCKYGIRIASDSCSAEKISENTVKGCSGYSIYISGKSKVKTISSNYVCGGKSSGIYLNKKASATTISKNTVDVVTSSGDGICINDSAKVTEVIGNSINTKTKKDSKKLKVNCKYGIRINSASCKAKKISDNTINSCGKTAIYIPASGSKITVSGNKIKKTQNGIVYKKGKAKLSKNTIQNCSSAKTKTI